MGWAAGGVGMGRRTRGRRAGEEGRRLPPHPKLCSLPESLVQGYELQGQAEKGEPRKMGSVGGAVRTEAKASWNGVARKGGGTWRRLDVRVYPRHLLPLAVCYFTGEAG